MKPILEIQNIGKKYQIQHLTGGYLSLRERMMSAIKFQRNEKEDFWALKDVSFEVQPGESLGIIGKNGAGKSTLLKILSKITPPNTGRIVSRGRIASLLEVGTGFHPELTGRENVFFNGSLLGMKRREIEAKFDEIVDFSGVEKFLDTPLKHYSSGMQLRLAFAVAAFLEPEILIIDEVLAVGDAEFQKKCLGKMEDVSKSGRTILFVSHNMGSIKSLCKQAILVDGGKIRVKDSIQNVIEQYFLQTKNEEGVWEFTKPKEPVPGFVKKLMLTSVEGASLISVPMMEPFCLKIQFTIAENIKHFIIGVGMTTLEDFSVRTVWSKAVDISPGDYEAVFEEKAVFFGPGKYKVIIGLSSREQSFQYLPEAAIIEIENSVEKDKVINSALGIILNPMESKIEKSESIKLY